MRSHFQKFLASLGFVVSQCFCQPLLAADFVVEVEIPRMDVAEYHAPYVAMWIADESNKVAMNLMVLYDLEMADEEGEKWLKDIRQWWRRSGRSLDMPVDGIVGATPKVGLHEFAFNDKVKDLEPGSYKLIVEAVREVGGREMVEIPFTWPVSDSGHLSINGEAELGQVSLMIAP